METPESAEGKNAEMLHTENSKATNIKVVDSPTNSKVVDSPSKSQPRLKSIITRKMTLAITNRGGALRKSTIRRMEKLKRHVSISALKFGRGKIGFGSLKISALKRKTEEDTENKAKENLAELLAAGTKDDLPENKKYVLAALESNIAEALMFFITIVALYGSDLNMLYGSKSFDENFGWISLGMMIIFLVECSLLSWAKPKYFMRAFFYLDLLAALSLIGDIPFLAKEIFPSGFAAARAGRASRAGTRAGRLVRVIRLIRLTRLVRILKKAKKGNGQKSNTSGANDASSMTNQITMLTAAKVIVGLLLMLIVTPFLDPSPINESRLKGLKQIESICTDTIAGCTKTPDVEPFISADANQCLTVTSTQLESLSSTYSTTFDNLIYLKLNNTVFLIKNDMMGTLRESEMQHAWISDTVWENVSDAIANESFMASFNISSQRHNEARYSMYSTTFLITLLVVGMIAFNRDAKKISTVISEPLGHIGDEMEAISMMNMEFKATRIESNVYEIKRMQDAVYKMRKCIDSFTKFIPREVVKNMIQCGQDAVLSVQDREVTTFFSDVAAFTTICEQMDPLPLIELLTEYFDSVSPLIIDSGGSILDYIGDAVLACWNAPQTVENHAFKAIEQSLKMHEVLNKLRVKWEAKMYPPFYIRCGIHTGRVWVGNVGGTQRMKYSVLGDGVDVAERLEDGNKKYGGRMMITEDTMKGEGVTSTFLLKHVDFIQLPDKKAPTAVYNVICRNKDASKQDKILVDTHNRGMTLYADGQFSEAAALFEEVLAMNYVEDFVKFQYTGTDLAAKMLLDRCKRLAKEPRTPDWNIADESPI